MIAIDYIVLCVYFLVVAGIGVWAMRRTKRQEDYFMGGRTFGKLMQTFAAFGAGTGAQDPILVGRTTWTSGLTGIWSVLMWLFVTPAYWIIGVWYRRMRHLTLGDYFVERYESPWMGVAYTFYALAFCCMYLSTMFTGVSAVATSMAGFDTIEVFGSTLELQTVLVFAIAFFVIVYGALGGLTAAYYTDLIQGICIILLSVLLIPFGLQALVDKFGDPETQGLADGFKILHERLPESYFDVVGGPLAGEFPFHYIVSLMLLALVGIVVQPHFIATGGGSAKTEFNARVGLVTGNFLKRLCTVGWALTGLIVLALLADSVEIAQATDRAWGVAARELLGTAKLGLVGLMLACLLAAMMSTADAFMLVCSALVVHNIYARFINPNASERTYVNAGRITGVVVIAGSVSAALAYGDVFKQYTTSLELTLLFAAPFWIGMYWRRATRWAAWGTVLFSLVMFFIAPIAAPILWPGLRQDARFAIATHRTTRIVTRTATEVDVARRSAWDKAHAEAVEIEDARERKAAVNAIGSRPPEGSVGDTIEERLKPSGGTAVFWGKLVSPDDAPQRFEEIERTTEGNVQTIVERRVGAASGAGSFNLDFLLYEWLGVDLAAQTPAMLKTMRLPPRLIAPFLVLIVLSLITPRNSRESLDRFYVKMKTEVLPDPEEDQRTLEESYRDPRRFDDRKLFAAESDFEFVKPRPIDVIGFLASIAICFVILGMLIGLVSIGA